MSKQNQPSLSEVQSAFAQWRESGKTRRTPPALRAQAVGLLGEYGFREVMKGLGVDHRRLSRWRQELSAPSGAFVELPAAPRVGTAEPEQPGSMALTLTYHAGDGSAVAIAGQLSAEQWGWALGLVQGAGS